MKTWGPGCEPRVLALACSVIWVTLTRGNSVRLSQQCCEVQIVDFPATDEEMVAPEFIQGQAQVSGHTKLPSHICPKFTNTLL